MNADDFPRDSKDIGPIDVDEFIGAYQYAEMVSDNEMVEEIPALERFKIIKEGSAFGLSNNPLNRFGMALARHFRKERGKMRSFMFRFWALEPLLEDPRFADYVRHKDSEHPEVHRAMIEAACNLPLGTNYEFEPQSFWSEVQSIAERKKEAE